MCRDVAASDVTTAIRVGRGLPARVDVLHGHGAKGGAYARLIALGRRWGSRRPRTIYTPHGGSLHKKKGSGFFLAERALGHITDGFLFTSHFAAAAYRDLIGGPPSASRVVHNGIRPADLAPLPPAADAADFVFVGELRELKGLDLLLHALVDVDATAVVVGSGPDAPRLRELAARLNLGRRVRFVGRLPGRDALALGRCLVVPSRAESLPYIVLEAAAAGVPLIATRVGGIPEIIGTTDVPLIAPGSVPALRSALQDFHREPAQFAERARRLRTRVASDFRAEAMATSILSFYGATLSS